MSWVWIPIPSWKEKTNFWIGLSTPVRSVLNVPHKHTRVTHAATTIITGKVKIAFKVIVCECLSACAGCVYGVRARAQVCHTAHAEVRGQFLKSELSFSGGWTPVVRLTEQVYLPVELSHSTTSWYIFIYIFNIPSQLSEGTLKIAVDERENEETRQLVKKKRHYFEKTK